MAIHTFSPLSTAVRNAIKGIAAELALQPVELTQEQLAQAVKTLHLEVTAKDITLRSGDAYYQIRLPLKPVEWDWDIEGQNITFTPELPWLNVVSYSGQIADLRKSIPAVLGYKPVTRPLPEPLVYLPVPAWVWVQGDDWQSIPVGMYVFASEVAEKIKEFQAELDKLVAPLATS